MNPQIKPLLPIVQRWKKMMVEYRDRVPQDAAYWHSERANCGVLSSAAWREGGVSLVAYGDEKDREGRTIKGRVDLWIQTSTGRRYVIEAKHLWIWAFSSSSTIREALKTKLDLAVEDAKRVPEPRDTRMGILFAVPGIRDTTDVEDALATFRDAYDGMKDLDLLEWVTLNPIPRWQNRRYPGVLLLGKVLPRRRRSSSRSNAKG